MMKRKTKAARAYRSGVTSTILKKQNEYIYLVWTTFGLLKLQIYCVAPFYLLADRPNLRPISFVWNAHKFPFWHSKFHNTFTPSACYRPRSDCLYSLVPASAGCPPYSLPLSFSVPDRDAGMRYNSLFWMCTLNTLTWPAYIQKLYIFFKLWE